MFYHEIKNGNTVTHEVEAFPPEIEALYTEVRQKYTIYFHLSDWADDDTDSGWGYDYDNSYSFYREPERYELVIRNGKLYGFWVGFNPRYQSLSRPDMLIPETTETVNEDRYCTRRYGDSREWKLITEETPSPCSKLFLLMYPHQNRDDDITAANFEGDWVKEVVWQRFVQDTRGHFDGASRLKLELTEKGIADPDGVLKAFARYGAYLVRK